MPATKARALKGRKPKIKSFALICKGSFCAAETYIQRITHVMISELAH